MTLEQAAQAGSLVLSCCHCIHTNSHQQKQVLCQLVQRGGDDDDDTAGWWNGGGVNGLGSEMRQAQNWGMTDGGGFCRTLPSLPAISTSHWMEGVRLLVLWIIQAIKKVLFQNICYIFLMSVMSQIHTVLCHHMSHQCHFYIQRNMPPIYHVRWQPQQPHGWSGLSSSISIGSATAISPFSFWRLIMSESD